MELAGEADHQAFAEGAVDREIADCRVDKAVEREWVGGLVVQLVDHRAKKGLLIADPREVAAVVVVPNSLYLVLEMAAAHQRESLNARNKLAAWELDTQTRHDIFDRILEVKVHATDRVHHVLQAEEVHLDEVIDRYVEVLQDRRHQQ